MFRQIKQIFCKHKFRYDLSHGGKIEISKATCIYCGKAVKDKKELYKLLRKEKV